MKRRNPLPWVDVENLLDEVDELKDLSSLLDTVLDWNLVDILLDSLGSHLLLFQLDDVVVLQKLPKVQVWVVPLWLLHRLMKMRLHTSHQELREVFEDVALFVLIKHEKPIPVDRMMNHINWG